MLQVQDKTILGFTEDHLDALGAGLTAREIAQQGSVWLRADVSGNRRAAVAAFLEPLLARDDLRIVLTGAGTSAFIGECLVPAMLAQGRRAEAIATTDLVSGPGLFFQPQVPTLLVSFARSGSSPESLAAVALADQLLPEVHHLIITCNAEGALYRAAQTCRSAYAILLPDATHDRGFAMTTSFTSMLLTAALAFDLFPAVAVERLARAALALPEQALPTMQALVAGQFRRVVYLGSNALRGLAREAALKLLELTDGQVVALFDSPLGFRHGPKTIVDSETLVVVMLSNDPHARRYDLDLLRELRRDGHAGRVLALSGRPERELGADCVEIGGVDSAGDLELALPYIVFCQCFALLQSLALGLRPDTPSVSGTVNRVVRGVTIHPFTEKT
ncbi:galactosamine 6-phosphate isomerase AgaS [Massilia sp. PDC64]|nr:SIS domain-containing protein [Massilia sp. PDC64]SDD66673.1 galactosamine 6-phosphate isomerase AgaS [Massilia sp. PDC64]